MVTVLSILTIILSVAADQVIKHFVCLYLKPIGSKVLIDGVLGLSYVENNGAMMGTMSGKTVFMTVASSIVVIVLLVVLFSKKLKPGVDYWCLVFIAAGGIGNIIDRIFRHFVVDYIEFLFVDFYVFNFADCLVTVGVFAIVIYEIYVMLKEHKQKNITEKGTTDA